MALVENSRERIGEKRLGVLFDGGKVRRRREWRGIKDTLYDYGRWLYLLSILAGVIIKPRNVKAMFRYRWFANYLAVPHMLDHDGSARRAAAHRAHGDGLRRQGRGDMY